MIAVRPPDWCDRLRGTIHAMTPTGTRPSDLATTLDAALAVLPLRRRAVLIWRDHMRHRAWTMHRTAN